VKAALKSKFGNVMTLYRGQGEVSTGTPQRHTLSWTSDPRIAAWFAGINPWLMKLKPITDGQITSALETYGKTGEVKFLGKRYVRTETPTNEDGKDEFYYEIYDRDGELLTDGDDLKNEFKDVQEYYQELVDKRTKTLEKVVKAEIPIDDIIWITDRSGQSEFILHNRHGAKGYLDASGKLIKG
jgi:hypothetical protein